MSRFVSAMMMGSPLLLFPLIALGLFGMVFVMTSVRALRRKASTYEHVASLPLEDDTVHKGGHS